MALRSLLQLPSVSSQALDLFTSAGSTLSVSISAAAVIAAVVSNPSSASADIHLETKSQVK